MSNTSYMDFVADARQQPWFFPELAECDTVDTMDTTDVQYPTYPSGLWRLFHHSPAERANKLHLLDDTGGPAKDLADLRTRRDVLTRLGVAKTAGSLDVYPPKLSACLAAFTEPNRPDSASTLTKGARALNKHCHRDQTDNFWGTMRGGDAMRNDHALAVLRTILTDVAWCNVFFLDDTTNIIEVRSHRGYGVRWTADGAQFRGFVEPPMEDGHRVGWRH